MEVTQIFDIIQDTNKNLNAHQTMSCLRMMFQHVKHRDSSFPPSEILKHPDFETLCQSLKRNSRILVLNDIIDALKILSYFGVPPDSSIMLVLLSLIRFQINDVTIGHILFLDILLRKLEKTPLVEALMMALPMLFQIQMGLKIDRENVRELSDCLYFATRNQVNSKCITIIVTALTLHGENLKPMEAANILRGLCDVKPVNVKYHKLVKNCFNVLSQNINSLQFKTISSVLSKGIDSNSMFYNAEYFDKCATFVVEHDGGLYDALSILKKFNDISYLNFELLNYVLSKLIIDPKLIETATPGYLMTLVSGLSIANYSPPEWHILMENVLRNPLFESQKLEFPWLKLTVELLSIGCNRPDLIQKVFNPDFLERFLERKNAVDYFFLLMLYQNVKTSKESRYEGPWPDQEYLKEAENLIVVPELPLEAPLKYLYSNSCVISRARTRLGHFMDHAIVFDQQGIPLEVDLESRENVNVEDLLEQGYKVIGIIRPPRLHYVHNLERLKGIFTLRIKGLEEILPVVVVSVKSWNNLSDSEKLPYLEQLISEKLN